MEEEREDYGGRDGGIWRKRGNIGIKKWDY
jgi:hypothetical protein